jgi:hypothetical protein
MSQTRGPFGWEGPEPTEIVVTNRTGSAVAVGDVEMLDNFRDQAESTSNTAGLSTAGVANAVVPLAKARQVGIFGVIQKSTPDDQRTTMRLRGYCQKVRVSAAVVLTTPSLGAVPLTTEVVRVVVNQPAGTAAAGEGIITKLCFIPLTAIGATGLTDGWFNGVEGVGWITEAT